MILAMKELVEVEIPPASACGRRDNIERCERLRGFFDGWVTVAGCVVGTCIPDSIDVEDNDMRISPWSVSNAWHFSSIADVRIPNVRAVLEEFLFRPAEPAVINIGCTRPST